MASHDRWWIKLNDRIHGPVSARELRQLASLGTVDAETAVSPDGRTWHPASTVRGLNAKAVDAITAVTSREHGTQRTTSGTDRAAVWIGAVIAAVIVVGLMLACGLSMVFTPADPSNQTATPPEANLVLDATWEYWHAIGTQFQPAAAPVSTAEEAALRLEQAATVLEQLPTVHVDPDAVAFGLDLATMLRRLARRVRRRNDPSVVFESMFRGYMGDPFGVAVEEMQLDQELVQQFEAFDQQYQRTRATLTARYGVEFPQVVAGTRSTP